MVPILRGWGGVEEKETVARRRSSCRGQRVVDGGARVEGKEVVDGEEGVEGKEVVDGEDGVEGKEVVDGEDGVEGKEVVEGEAVPPPLRIIECFVI